MSESPDYILDISAGDDRSRDREVAGCSSNPTPPSRPYISVRFDCCRVYVRIYRSADGTRYAGACPRCGKPVNFRVGQGGTDARFFVVS